MSGSLFSPTRDRGLLLLWLVALCMVWVQGRWWFVHGWGMDSHTYWSVWAQHPMYSSEPGITGANLYSPLFAQAIWPLTLLSWPAFVVVWLILGLATWWWLLRPVPWMWALPLAAFAIEDLRVGNLTWLLALVCVLGMRRPALWVVALFTKVGPAVGVLWFVSRREWRAVAEFAVTAVVLGAVSFALAPDLWRDWFALIRGSHGIGAPVRLVIAAAMTLYAGRRGWAWMVPIAVIVASPVSAVYTLGYLCAVPRLLSPEALERARAPFGGLSSTLRRALDLEAPVGSRQ